MLLRHIYDARLAQASYLVGCQATGEAIVVDPNRDVEQYVRAAAADGVRITQVTETHIHADFVSGARELAQRTGAQLLLSDEGDAEWKYAYAAQTGARLLKDGDVFQVGNLRFQVLHTPGHTPEHISFLVTDTPATDQPMGALTGDFVFVGDVGRPDLLEKAAKVAGTMEAGARTLYRSLQKFKQLPDHLQLWPGHGAGSACGKALGAVPQSTLGYEKLANWALRVTDEDEFVELVLAGQPDPPTYFAQMKRINKAGPRVLGGFQSPERLSVDEVEGLLHRGAFVIDTRPAAAFAAGHLPGTISIPLNKSFTTWAGWLAPYDRELYLVADADCARCVDEAVRDLAMIGLDRVAGYVGTDAVAAWADRGHTLETTPQTSVAELAERLATSDVTVLDVRNRAEWEAGHLPGVPNIPLGQLETRLQELPRDRPLVLHCQSGGRSAIAASVLRAHGFHNVENLTGGFTAWRAAGHPVHVERDAHAAPG
ncbi:MAG TPA: MBL fold metallo-hydrolase [Gemmatimonadaceae bacterium]|nr:MBL fold metallo-hydrolase [Gemmatimonadaceae bacterium]